MSTNTKWHPLKLSKQYPNYGAVGQDSAYSKSEKLHLSQSQATAKRKHGWFASMGGVGLLFICGGMSVIYGLDFSSSYQYEYNTNDIMTSYTNISWFLMAIIGAAVGAMLTNKLKKEIFMLISSLLILQSGILILCEVFGAFQARHINGFALGIIFVPALVMAGEESPIGMRGAITSSIEMLCFAFGAFLQTIFKSELFDEHLIHGILLIVLSVTSLFFVFFLMVESPVYFLMHNQEEAAFDSIRLLFHRNNEQLESFKSYIAHNNEKSWDQAKRESLPTLIKLCILRGIAGMSFSFALFMTVLNVAEGAIVWPPICRVIGILMSIFLQDSVGRKNPLAFGMLTSGTTAIYLTVSWDLYGSNNNSEWQAMSMCLLMYYEIFVGMAVTSSTSYLSEAFPMAVKPYCIAIAFTVEMFSLMFWTFFDLNVNSLSVHGYTLGVLSLAYFFLTIYCLPETKNTTLLDAQVEFDCTNRTRCCISWNKRAEIFNSLYLYIVIFIVLLLTFMLSNIML